MFPLKIYNMYVLICQRGITEPISTGFLFPKDTISIPFCEENHVFFSDFNFSIFP